MKYLILLLLISCTEANIVEVEQPKYHNLTLIVPDYGEPCKIYIALRYTILDTIISKGKISKRYLEHDYKIGYFYAEYGTNFELQLQKDTTITLIKRKIR
jgi:hypothetical protein